MKRKQIKWYVLIFSMIVFISAFLIVKENDNNIPSISNKKSVQYERQDNVRENSVSFEKYSYSTSNSEEHLKSQIKAITNEMGLLYEKIKVLEREKQHLNKLYNNLKSKEDNNHFDKLLIDLIKSLDKLEANEKIEDIEKLREDIYNIVIAEKVEEIVNGISDEQEKCIRIAKWVSTNISNSGLQGNDVYEWYSNRSGLCGERAIIFVKMIKYLNMDARVFNLYNFGQVGGAHSCAQVYYNNKWHFFDVTYAGVFMKNNDVMSWDEILKDPSRALKGMVIFEKTMDKWKTNQVDNNLRMREVYTDRTLKESKSYGFYQYEDLKILYPQIDWSKLDDKKVVLGELNDTYIDVSDDGINKKISERLGEALGTGFDTFHTVWEFKNCVPGTKYIIKYHIYRSTESGLKFWAKSIDTDIKSGNEFISKALTKEDNEDIWEITFIPRLQNCSISIGYDFRKLGKALYIDKLEIFSE